MQTTVLNYIYDQYNERGMKTFERKITKLLKDNGLQGEFIALNAYMERGNGRGSYYNVAELSKDGNLIRLREHTNDSCAWDNWEYPTKKETRNLFLGVLENNVLNLVETD